MKVGLALGGGGGRCLAHIGVLHVLEEEGVPIDFVAGASFGALIAALYAQTPHIDTVRKKVLEYLTSPSFERMRMEVVKKGSEEGKNCGFFTYVRRFLSRGIIYGITFTRPSFLSEKEFVDHLSLLFGDTLIEETKLPLIIVAADLKRAQGVVLERGSVKRAVAASCSLPGVFPPVTMAGQYLVDGGWVHEVPVSPLRERGMTRVIAVDTSQDPGTVEEFRTGLDVLLRANLVTRRLLRHKELAGADLVIRPAVGDRHWADFSRVDVCIAEGESATRSCLTEIKRRTCHDTVGAPGGDGGGHEG